jgi:hypothetical protein
VSAVIGWLITLRDRLEGWTIVDMKNDWKRVFSFEGNELPKHRETDMAMQGHDKGAGRPGSQPAGALGLTTMLSITLASTSNQGEQS